VIIDDGRDLLLRQTETFESLVALDTVGPPLAHGADSGQLPAQHSTGQGTAAAVALSSIV
jgi:hypothetical protein